MKEEKKELLLLEEKPWQIHSECTTKPTEPWPSCERHSCDSAEATFFECPEGWVMDHQHYEKVLEQNGTNNYHYLVFEKFIRPFPDIPQIEYPTKVTLSVHARSSGGCSSGRGWTKATVKGRMFSYKQLVENLRKSLTMIEKDQ